MRKITLVSLLLLSFAVLTGCFVLKKAPYPAAMLIRYEFEKQGKKVNDDLEKHVPLGVSEMVDISYDDADRDAQLDLYFPTKQKKPLPLIVWVHGGAWVSGNKSQNSNYYKILASKGYVVAALDYSIAPEKTYPAPVKQVMTALQFLEKNSTKINFDPSVLFMGGDSAGSHIAAQVANIISNPEYADLMQITPTLDRSKIRGLILYCGPYDAANIDLNSDFGKFLNTVLWSYSGDKNFMTNKLFQSASVINYIDKNFPPTFLSAGNGDPLLIHSEELAKKLKSLKVEVDTLFFPKDLTPKLPHEYQFNLDNQEGQTALQRSVKFLEKHSY